MNTIDHLTNYRSSDRPDTS